MSQVKGYRGVKGRPSVLPRLRHSTTWWRKSSKVLQFYYSMNLVFWDESILLHHKSFARNMADRHFLSKGHNLICINLINVKIWLSFILPQSCLEFELKASLIFALTAPSGLEHFSQHSCSWTLNLWAWLLEAFSPVMERNPLCCG